ncbi:MAG: YcaO-like family protein [Desulforegulaceae bacterium]|nr:YcaO-like family protein [Desulforegulaceae bacterium]
MIEYKLKLQDTLLSIGYFAPVPEKIDTIEKGLIHLLENKFDSFMRNHLISLFLKTDKENQKNLIENFLESKSPEIKSFGAELLFLNQKKESSELELKEYSPLIYLRTLDLTNTKEHNFFSSCIKKNTRDHLLINEKCPDFSFEDDKIFFEFPIDKIVIPLDKKSDFQDEKNSVFFEEVLSKFNSLSISPGNEMRHFNTLSPHGILRKWYMKTKIKTKKADFSFQGVQTSYGKGFDLEKARISCLMEMCERRASFISVEDMRIADKRFSPELIKLRMSEGIKNGLNMLDPNDLRLEVPYSDYPLYWIKALEVSSKEKQNDIYIPAQASFLFLNLDEPDLFSSLDSTGLAAGDTIERAKLAGILEAIERDCEFTSPFELENCFKLKSKSDQINSLLEFYRSRGIDFFFQFIKNESKIPCYKAFVYGIDNLIYKGCSADLNGKKALIDALFEVPYPTLNNYPSKKITYPLKEIYFEDLPDYSSNSIKQNLELLERYFIKNKIRIIYSDLTQSSLEIPVFKTIIPGLELNGDFDSFHRVSKRQFENFKKIFTLH